MYIKDREIANAPFFLREFLTKQHALLQCIQDSDVCKNWSIPENISGGIHGYLQSRPTEYTWKLQLKKQKLRHKLADIRDSGDKDNPLLRSLPQTDQEVYDTVSSDDDMQDQPYKSPEMERAELCICMCTCNGAPKITAPSFPIMKRAMAAVTTTTTISGAATVYFDAPLNKGNSSITGYQVTSIPENRIRTGMKSPITIKNLRVGVWYSFVVRARNRRGLSPPSAESNQVLISDPKFVSQLEQVYVVSRSVMYIFCMFFECFSFCG